MEVPLLIVDDDRTEETAEYVQYSVNSTMSRITFEEPSSFIIEDDDGKMECMDMHIKFLLWATPADYES